MAQQSVVTLVCFHHKKNRQSNMVTLTFTIDSPIFYLSFFLYFSRNGLAIQEINVYMVYKYIYTYLTIRAIIQ